MYRGLIPGLAAAIALAFGAPAAQAQVSNLGPANRPFPPSYSNRAVLDERVHIRTGLKKLHDDAVATQKADGGTLSEAHRAELTERMEALRRQACAAGMAGC
jgi:hypothetical protein